MKLIDIYTDTCPQCKALDPIIDNIQHEYPDLEVIRMNAEDNEDFCIENKIRNVPTILLYKDKDIVWRNVGVIGQGYIEEKIKENAI